VLELTELMVTGEPLLVMDTFCGLVVPPAEALRVTTLGVAARPTVPPVPTVRLTTKFTVPEFVLMATVPE
jgi:hypothetical protein